MLALEMKYVSLLFLILSLLECTSSSGMISRCLTEWPVSEKCFDTEAGCSKCSLFSVFSTARRLRTRKEVGVVVDWPEGGCCSRAVLLPY